MPKYHFLGGTTNLGRFGTVKRGDVLVLTDKEEEAILTNGPEGKIDPRFQPFKEGTKIDGAGLDLPEGFEQLTKEGQAAARQTAEDERKRLEALNQATNPRAGTAGAGATGQPSTTQTTGLRQVKAVPQPTPPDPNAPVTLPPGKTKEQLESEEIARLQRLQQANSSTDVENYREMTRAELLEVVDEIRRDGKPVDLKKDASRQTILRAVLAAKGLSDDTASDEDEPPGS
jgi:hypothetical protein